MSHGRRLQPLLLLPLAAAVVHIPLTAKHGRRGALGAKFLGTQNVTNFVANGWQAEPAPSDVNVHLQNRETFYTASMQVGTPPVAVRMLVDSGSSNMWLKQRSEFSIMELDSVDFDLGLRPPPVHFTYGVGEISGAAASGQVCLGSLCVPHQDFLLAQVINHIGNLQDFDGFLGLAFPQMLDVGRRTFLQQLQEEGGYRNLGFALCLRGERGSSSLSLGEVEDLIQEAQQQTGAQGLSLKVQGLETEADLSAGFPGTFLFWLVPMSLRVERPRDQRKQHGLLMDLSGFAMLDSGSSLILVSPKSYGETMASLTYGTNAMGLTGDLDCKTTQLNELVVHFTSDGRELEVRLESQDLLLPVATSQDGRPLCRIGIDIMSDKLPLPSMVLGDVFLRKVHVIHDMASPSVTLVPDATRLVEPTRYLEGPEALQLVPSLVSACSLATFLLACLALGRVFGRPYLPLPEPTDDYIKL